MCLAWNDLCMNINHEPLSLALKDNIGSRIAFNFNNNPFILNDLSADSCYVKSGFGQQTVEKINKEVRQKFPNKTFADLQLNLEDRDVVAYAYFVKEVQYLVPFEIQQ